MTLATAMQYYDPLTGTGVRTFNSWTPSGQTIQAIRQIDGSSADGSKAPDVGTRIRAELDAMVLRLF